MKMFIVLLAAMTLNAFAQNEVSAPQKNKICEMVRVETKSDFSIESCVQNLAVEVSCYSDYCIHNMSQGDVSFKTEIAGETIQGQVEMLDDSDLRAASFTITSRKTETPAKRSYVAKVGVAAIYNDDRTYDAIFSALDTLNEKHLKKVKVVSAAGRTLKKDFVLEVQESGYNWTKESGHTLTLSLTVYPMNNTHQEYSVTVSDFQSHETALTKGLVKVINKANLDSLAL